MLANPCDKDGAVTGLGPKLRVMRHLISRQRSGSPGFQSGQGLIEFGIILSVVSVTTIALLGLLGADVLHLFTSVSIHTASV